MDEKKPEEILRKLKQELSLNKIDVQVIPDLFPDQHALEQYRIQTITKVLTLSPLERVDFGIAHFEMGLFSIAVSIFETIVRYEKCKIVGTYLLSLALIYDDRAAEAIFLLEPFARDLTLTEESKVDFLYLMGLAFEHLSNYEKAREFYQRASILNPKYKDVSDKLK